MPRILLHLRAMRTVAALDPDAAAARTAALAHWRARVRDTRLSDAPFLTVEAEADALDAAAVDELKAALAGLPDTRAMLRAPSGRELPLADATLDDFRRAAGDDAGG